MTEKTQTVCRHSGICGGCSLQHLSYPAQLVRKEAALRDRLPAALRPIVGGDGGPLFVPVFGGRREPWHFRQKVTFVFGSGPGGRGLVMGHFRRGSQRIVPVEECPVHSARGNRIAFALRELLAHAGIGAAGSSRAGVLRHLIIRTTEDDREAVAMLVVTRNDRSLRRPVRALLDSEDRPDGFFVNIHSGPGPFMVGPTTIRVDGRRHVRENLNGLWYLVSPTAFFQTTTRAAAALQQLVLAGIGRASRVLDLYCGSGLFSLPLAVAGSTVVGVEENQQAVKDAEANGRLNRLAPRRIRFLCARVEHALTMLSRERWDAVILDPPRPGCPAAVLARVFRQMAPPRAVYVSCSPDALAAELPTILNAGYDVEQVRAVDMFPHTDHIETVVTLVHR